MQWTNEHHEKSKGKKKKGSKRKHVLSKQTNRERTLGNFVFCFVNDRRVSNKFRSSHCPSPAHLCRSLSAVVSHRRNVREHVQCDSDESGVCGTCSWRHVWSDTVAGRRESARQEGAVSPHRPGPPNKACRAPACLSISPRTGRVLPSLKPLGHVHWQPLPCRLNWKRLHVGFPSIETWAWAAQQCTA